MKLIAVTLAFTLATSVVVAQDDQFSGPDAGEPLVDPSFVPDYCRACLERRNQNDYYPDPNNCERFYHCYIDEAGAVGGIARKCPEGERFSDKINSCVQRFDGRVNDPVCDVDECEQTETMSAGFWYSAEVNCGIYFLCSNFHSIRKCCRPNHAYDATTEECVADENCTVHNPECSATSETDFTDPTDVTDNECTDADYGVRRRINADAPYRYFVLFGFGEVDAGTETEIPMLCARGTAFSLATCRCSENFEWVDVDLSGFNGHERILDIGFNNAVKIEDDGKQNLWIDNNGAEKVVIVANENAEIGVGEFNGNANLEVPAFQGIDLRSSTFDFWCYSECANAANGDIKTLFSYGDSDLAQNPNAITGVVYLEKTAGDAEVLKYVLTSDSPSFPESPLTLAESPALNCGQWNHIAIVNDFVDKDASQIVMHVNCDEDVVTVDLAGRELIILEKRLRKCPLTIGKSNAYPDFIGKLDAFRVTRGVLDSEAICAQRDATNPSG